MGVKKPCKCLFYRVFDKWAIRDLNNPALSPKNAENETLGGKKCITDPDLAALIAAWPGLPEHTKTAVMALIHSCKPQ
jgi:hypothetical protein